MRFEHSRRNRRKHLLSATSPIRFAWRASQSITGIGDAHPRPAGLLSAFNVRSLSDNLFPQDTGDAMKVGMESYFNDVLIINLDSLLSLNENDVFRLHGEVFVRENILLRRNR
jgi:hypothetical protein